MGLWNKLGRASNYLRKLRLSMGADSYFQYKRGRKYERKQADDKREHAHDFADRERKAAERRREYDERYTRECEGDVARERTERAEEVEPDR
jgi:hypothetical protein